VPLSWRARALLIAPPLVVGLFLLVDWAVEYLWLEALGLESVFWTIRPLKAGLFLSAFVSVLLYFWINFRILSSHLDVATTAALMARAGYRSGTAVAHPSPANDHDERSGRARSGTPGLLILVAVAIALIFAAVFYSQWDTLLRFHWSLAYGKADPIYNRDIGFYLFELPFLELLQNGMLAATFIASGVLMVAYSSAGLVRLGWREGVSGPPEPLRHFAANLALSLVALAWGYYLDRFALLQSSSGAVYGAGYTDVYIVRPALWIGIGATLALAAVLLFPRTVGKDALGPITVGGYLVVLVMSLIIVPRGVQSFHVEPNELELEQPFLRHNIAFTREAYSLDRIDERSYSPLNGLTLADLGRNNETISNIRLWDWRPLGETFRQLQRIRAYYELGDVDVDRYRVGDADRQVMLAARELSGDLPGKAETWVNRYLQYTHGYGLAMSLTAEKDAQGAPVLVVKDLPPVAESGLSVAQPAIYYGEAVSDYRIVATSVPEFDHPKGDENVYTSYAGHGGIRLDSFWKRLLFALHQFDVSIVLTSYITPDSRIQLWRSVQDRIRRIAPFLRLDDDPYLVISDGRLHWIQDAYTASSWFPYAEPHLGEFNYIRNSVKVVVDAYEGAVNFYVIEPDDPVLSVYRDALPALFTALDRMPEELRHHVRYPQDLFESQVAKYSRYHMTVPQVFYNDEDLWAVPWERGGGEQLLMEPYYVLMKLPQEEQLQFLLMIPLTPSRRDNMIAWMAARCDFPAYGELIVYKLPKERLILGPIQIEATINQDPLISQQLTLWDQRGSRVIRGNLLVIPIEQSFLYVEPVYLVAVGTNIPQLKRVIVSDGERLAMEPTLQEALAVVLGRRDRGALQAQVAEESDQLSRAREALVEAESALREGDWDTFGAAMQRLKHLLGE
jgi:uncharacterized membrane protein (UPF0182 family)